MIRWPTLSICAACWMLLSPTAMASDCDKLQSGSGSWSSCKAANQFREADEKLNLFYGNLMRILSGEDTKTQRQRLIQSQKTWLRYREQYCQFASSTCSGTPQICDSVYESCRARLTESRAEEIISFSEQWQ
jgi:uncharacterized protein YecT (DUF1311 family)